MVKRASQKSSGLVTAGFVVVAMAVASAALSLAMAESMAEDADTTAAVLRSALWRKLDCIDRDGRINLEVHSTRSATRQCSC
jgi:hypothetical protein